MSGASDKNQQVFEDFATFLRALMPEAVGFYYYDKTGAEYWRDTRDNGIRFTDDYDTVLQRLLRHGDLPGETGKVELAPYTAYLIRVVCNDGHLMGALTAIVDRDMAGMPHKYCADLLQPATRSLERELSLRLKLLQARQRSSVRNNGQELLEELAALVKQKEPCFHSLTQALNLGVDHLRLKAVDLVLPERSIRISSATDKLALTDSEMLVERVLENTSDELESTGSDDKRAWFPIEDQSGNLLGLLIFHRGEGRSETWAVAKRLGPLMASTIDSLLFAAFDELTGLGNWSNFEHELREGCRADEVLTLIYANVDQLHVVNDTFGRSTGDEVLRQFANLVKRIFAGYAATRVSSDGFAILLREGDANEAEERSNRLCEALNKLDYVHNGQTFRPSVSIGIAPFEGDENEIPQALVPAQVACQAAQDRGRGRVELYQAGDTSIVRRLDDIHIVGSVRSAIESGRLALVAQPIEPLKSRHSTHYYEILVRMLDMAGNMVAPAEFFSAAERYQLMTELDRWVIENTLKTLQPALTQLEIASARYAVNLSGQSLGDAELLDFVEQQFDLTGVPRNMIAFEITETAAVANLQRAQNFISRMRAQGTKFSIDDFGTGLSSFGYLKMFQVDTLKIDGSFICDIKENHVSRCMVGAVSEFARAMRLETVAEFVEDAKTLEFLGELGVTWAQGYHIGQPLPLADTLPREIDFGLGLERELTA